MAIAPSWSWIAILRILAAMAMGVPDESRLAVPAGFEPISVPAHNVLTPAKISLGERLFFDPVLSRDHTVSCGSCHLPDHVFSDGRIRSLGIDSQQTLRNSPSIVNVAYQKRFFWDGGGLTLESQVLGPLQEPTEMHISLDTALIRLEAEPEYAQAFRSAFDEAPSVRSLTQALAAYMRTIRSGGARYDQFVEGDLDVFTQQELAGYALFNGRANCVLCHSGPLLTNLAYESNGVDVTPADSGRARITGQASDYGKFKVPSLRNVAETAPYMHDGRMESLSQVVAHYSNGGEGVRNQNAAIRPLELSETEQQDLIAFLYTLTDSTILTGLSR